MFFVEFLLWQQSYIIPFIFQLESLSAKHISVMQMYQTHWNKIGLLFQHGFLFEVRG